jgi:hypothetical protein
MSPASMYAMLDRQRPRQFRFFKGSCEWCWLELECKWNTDLFPGQPRRPNEKGCAAAFLSFAQPDALFSQRSGTNSSGLEKLQGEREVAHEGTETVGCEFHLLVYNLSMV